MPKLLQINSYRGSGSIGRIAESIGEVAREAGWTCYVASGVRYSGKSAMREVAFDSVWAERFHALLSLLFDAHGRASWLATRRLIRKIREIGPDVVHIHNVHGYYLNYRLFFRFLASADIPVVWTFHDCWPITGHCAYFPGGCGKWKEKCRECGCGGSYPKSLFVDRSERNFLLKKKCFTSVRNLHLVAVSEWMKTVLSASFMKGYPIYVFNNGINLDIFKPEDSSEVPGNSSDKKFVVLGVASVWDVRKGLAEFARLGEMRDYRVVVVGVSREQKAELPMGVVAVERTGSQEELARYYREADVFVNPTYNDTFPTVNLEALACGTPVVTYDTCGSPEAVDADTGIVVPKGDFRALVDAIERIRRNGKAHYSAECRRRAETLFEYRKCCRKYVGLYDSLLK